MTDHEATIFVEDNVLSLQITCNAKDGAECHPRTSMGGPTKGQRICDMQEWYSEVEEEGLEPHRDFSKEYSAPSDFNPGRKLFRQDLITLDLEHRFEGYGEDAEVWFRLKPKDSGA